MIAVAKVHINKKDLINAFCKNVLNKHSIKFKLKNEGFSISLYVDKNENTDEIKYAFQDFQCEYANGNVIEGEFEKKGISENISKLNPIFTFSSMIFFVLVFFLQGIFGKPFMDIMFFHDEIGLGLIFEPWKYITPALMHGSPFHLFMNMFALYQLGPILERTYGYKKLLTVLAVTALCGNIMQAIITGPAFLGISGGIFGLIGYLWMKKHTENEPLVYLKDSIMLGSLIWIGLGYLNVIPGIDFANEAHLFGLLSGVIYCKFEKQRKKNEEINF